MGSFQIQWLTKRFGSIPKSWSTVPLDDLFEERRETSSDTTKYPLHSLIIGLGIVPKTDRYNRAFLLRDEEGNQYKLVYPGDFVFNPMNLRFGAIAYSRCESVVAVSAYYNVLKPRKSKFDTQYLYELLVSYPMVDLYDLVAIGSLIEKRRVHWSEFRKLVVPLPPLDEQKAIGAVIRNGDKAIALTEQLIAAKKQRKKALMQQLLTGKRRFKEFESKPWRQVRFKDVAVINPPKPKHLPDDTLVSFITMSDVSEEAQVVNATDRPHREVRTGFTSFQDKDILVAKITPCFENGKGALVQDLKNGFGFGSTEFHVIRVDESQANSQFVYYHTTTHNFRGRGEASMVGSAGQKRVRKDFIRSYQFILPPLQEQCKIAAVLQACDTEINLLRQKAVALQRQKKGLMQQLLTGRVRVKV